MKCCLKALRVQDKGALHTHTHTHTHLISEKQNESGRSMVEMLGMLAIVGLLSVVGIAGIGSALTAHKANTIVNEVNRRATILAADKNFGAGFTPNETFENDTGYTIACANIEDSDLFSCTVEGVSQEVCEKVLGLGWKMPSSTLPAGCSATNDMVFTFNKELDGSGRKCSEETPCPNPNASCTNGVCVDPAPKTCNNDNPTNPCGDECQVCNAANNKCENACVQKKYLQSNGNQWIDTNWGSSDGFKAQLLIKTTSLQSSNKVILGSCDTNGQARNFLLYRPAPNMAVGMGGHHCGNKSIQAETLYNVEFSTILSNSYLTLNGSKTQCTGVGNQTLSSNDIRIFNVQYAGHIFAGQVYWVKLYNRVGNLVRDFIPVVSPEESKCSGKPAMYDKVTKGLFCNQGSGNFTTD